MGQKRHHQGSIGTPSSNPVAPRILSNPYTVPVAHLSPDLGFDPLQLAHTRMTASLQPSTELLEDLCTRFILNVPAEELE